MNLKKVAYSLTKSIHHIDITRQYLTDVTKGCSGGFKDTINGYISRCEWMLNDLFDKMGSENREIFKEEIKDSLSLDHITDQLC